MNMYHDKPISEKNNLKKKSGTIIKDNKICIGAFQLCVFK